MSKQQLTEEDVRRIFREMLHEYETNLNQWCFLTGIDGLFGRREAYKKHIDNELGLTNPDE